MLHTITLARCCLVVSLLMAAVPGAHAADDALRPVRLRCEYLVSPIAVDTHAPRLSWVNEPTRPDARGKRQTAYRVLAASRSGVLARGSGDLWDSGKVPSPDAIQVAYGGVPLTSDQEVWWKVRVWDEHDTPSDWSEPATWTMALLDQRDWSAAWLRDSRESPANEEAMFGRRPAPLFRTEFRLASAVARARLHICGLGYFEARVNGERAGDAVREPGWTNYALRAPYATHDVTGLLREGANALGVMLGNGWWNPLPLRMWGRYNLRDYLPVGEPCFIAQLHVEYEDGSRETITSNGDWRVGDGPVVRNNVYLGEEYDARLEQPGWDMPGFDDAHWRPVERTDGPGGVLRAQVAPPVRVTGTLKPRSITEPEPGVFIFDMGENIAGVARLRVEGPAGTEVALRYGELLYEDGALNGMTAVAGQIKGWDIPEDSGHPSTAWQRDRYTLRGGGPETFTPRFTFHGFRYVEVTGFPGTPGPENLEALVMHADVPGAGRFTCSNPLYNGLQDITRRAILGNLASVQSDCPHREKFAYGGDILACSEAVLMNFDMARFYTKAVNDLAEAVRPNGGFTETAPYVGIADEGLGDGAGPVGWGTAHPALLAQLYRHYGDLRLIEREYPRVEAWLELLLERADDGILVNGIGDHESIAPKPELSGTAFLAMNLELGERFARLLDRRADVRRWREERTRVSDAFNARYLEAATGRYESGTQAAQAFALYAGLVPEGTRAEALSVLVDDILNANNGHLTTGIFGTRYMLNVLSEGGRLDVAHTVAAQRDYPGWGHMLESGATTLWETWRFSDNTYSHNHPMFGSVSEWFFQRVAGIRPAEYAAGYDRVVIAPGPGGGVVRAEATHESIRGPIHAAWSQGETFTLRVTVPVGVEALIILPARETDLVLERGQPLSIGPGVLEVGGAAGAGTVRVGSGNYRFEVLPSASPER